MISAIPHDNCVCFSKLSSEEKPLNYYNGSQFIEVDTNSMYLFDAENKQWLKYSGGGFNMFASVNEHVYMLVGLSSDTKPINKTIGTGSRFIEMDTSKTYMYDAANQQWLEFSFPGGGGGGEGVSAVLTSALQAGLSVGGVTAGQTFPKGTPIETVIKTILDGIVPTPTELKLYWGTLDNTPTAITGALTQEDIPANVTATGISHQFTTTGLQYECFIYPAELGELTHIFENNLSFDLISNFTKTTISHENTEYNVYYYQDPVKLTDDKFEFKWN